MSGAAAEPAIAADVVAHGWIQTYSGGRFHPLAPRVGDVKLKDIARALSCICRFGGHCNAFYSVAQHSVLVSRLVPGHLALLGLLHDAAEAYLGDIPRPFKRLPMFDAYRAAEAAAESAIAERFGLRYPFPPEVKAADDRALAIEARDLMPQREAEAWSWMPEPGDWPTLKPEKPDDAMWSFLYRAQELGLVEKVDEVPV